MSLQGHLKRGLRLHTHKLRIHPLRNIRAAFSTRFSGQTWIGFPARPTNSFPIMCARTSPLPKANFGCCLPRCVISGFEKISTWDWCVYDRLCTPDHWSGAEVLMSEDTSPFVDSLLALGPSRPLLLPISPPPRRGAKCWTRCLLYLFFAVLKVLQSTRSGKKFAVECVTILV